MCIKPGLDSNRAPAASPPSLIPRRLLPLLLAALPQAASRFVIALWLLEVTPTLLPAARRKKGKRGRVYTKDKRNSILPND